MKKWVLFAVLLLCVSYVWDLPFEDTDVAELRPVQLIYITLAADGVIVETDTADAGHGATIHDALEDMKQRASGTVFLETAEFLLLSDGARSLALELSDVLRPGCAVCFVTEKPDLQEAVKYLSVHRPEVTLNDVRSGMVKPSKLLVRRGGMELK